MATHRMRSAGSRSTPATLARISAGDSGWAGLRSTSKPARKRLQRQHDEDAEERDDQQRHAPARFDHKRRRHDAGQHQPDRHAALLDREDQRRQVSRRKSTEQVRARRCRDRLPQPADEGAGRKERQPARGGDGEADAEGGHADLRHAHRAVAQDETAAAQGREEGRDRADGKIDTDQRRLDAEIDHDGRGDQRHRRPSQGGEGLLHRHGAERYVEWTGDEAAPMRLRSECRRTLRMQTDCRGNARARTQCERGRAAAAPARARL